MTTDFAERCRQLLPRFVASGPVRRMRKSELLPGELDGAPVIAKRMRKPNRVWDWYFAHEVAVYRAFAASPPPFAVPRVVATADDVLVIERLPIALAKLRRPYAALASSVLEAVLAMHDAIASFDFPEAPQPSPAVKAQLAQRLLEDPTASWISEGITRCLARGLIDDEAHVAALAALVDAPVVASHGDLLLRNAMQRADGRIVLVDWECAGNHVAGWDLALLWTQLDATGRTAIDAGITEHRRFDALIVFALCRELVFLDAFRTPDDHAGRRRVEADLAAVCARLLA